MAEADSAIKRFLLPRMYRHDRVMRIMRVAEGVVRDLYAHYVTHLNDLPPDWGGDSGETADVAARARRVADFIAGMTDRYALIEHARVFGVTADLR